MQVWVSTQSANARDLTTFRRWSLRLMWATKKRWRSVENVLLCNLGAKVLPRYVLLSRACARQVQPLIPEPLFWCSVSLHFSYEVTLAYPLMHTISHALQISILDTSRYIMYRDKVGVLAIISSSMTNASNRVIALYRRVSIATSHAYLSTSSGFNS